ncbi:MAG TPA: MFS transporter [Methylomirabilota bacterium]|nr:MFS transporter [Methylomirabilota bacterium]
MGAGPEHSESTPWWRLLNRYHWFVFIFAALGWMFDTMDQQIFTASRSLAMKELMPGADFETQAKYGGYVTMVFILGWATGGLIFGTMGDRWGRVKTMGLTIMIYAVFTGVSALAKSWEWFAFGRFITGFGVGGQFAVGAALVAEVMPEKARPHALGLFQALSAVGNIIGAKLLGVIVPHWGWQGLYYIGTFPAILSIIIFFKMKEPEKWVAAKAAAVKARSQGIKVSFGSLPELFSSRQWRKNAIVGVALAVAGVLGVWGVGFYSPELIDSTIPTLKPESKQAFERVLTAATPAEEMALRSALPATEAEAFNRLLRNTLRKGDSTNLVTIAALGAPQKERMLTAVRNSMPENEKTKLKSNALVLQQIGAFFGMYGFGWMAARTGRRPAFALALILGWTAVVTTFYSFQRADQIWYLWPLLGFGTLAPFGGYAIYFPELFPTRLRTTGTGLCYNVGRYFAAFGPVLLTQLNAFYTGKTSIPGFKLAAITVASFYFVGLIALIWAPETVNKPLPEDEKGFAH